MRINRWRQRRLPFIAVLVAFAWVIAACSSAADGPTVALPATISTPSVAPVLLPTPTPTPVPTSTPTPVPYVYDDYGFTVALDAGSSFSTINPAVAGWTDTEADLAQGLLTFTYKGASVLLYWLPAEQQTPATILPSTYQLLRSSQPSASFLAVSEGELLVSGETGRFGGFVATESTGVRAGGGLIGTWVCADRETAFSLTVTGFDAAALQIRFDRLVSGFVCS